MDPQTISLLAAEVGLPGPVDPSAEVLAACAAACQHYPPEARTTAEAQTLRGVFKSFGRAASAGAWVGPLLTFATNATGRRMFLEAEAHVDGDRPAFALRFAGR